MLSRLFFIALIAFSSKGYSQVFSLECQHELICQFIKDLHARNPTSKDIVMISSDFANGAANKRMLAYYLEKTDIKSIQQDSIYSIDQYEIKQYSCFPERVKIIDNKQEFDSLAYLHWLVVTDYSYKELPGMDSTELSEIRKTPLNFTPLSLGTPYFWKDFAVVSMEIADNDSYYLYQMRNHKWIKIKNLMDPR